MYTWLSSLSHLMLSVPPSITMLLARPAQPVFAAATAVALCVPQIGDMLYNVSDEAKWSLLHWDATKLLILAVATEAAFPISNSLIKIMQILLPSSTGKKPAVLEIERSGQ